MYLADVAAYLIAEGVATSGTIFYGPMKEEYPSAMILLQSYASMRPEPNMGDPGPTAASNFGRATRLEFPRMAVICRGVKNDTDTPYTLAYSAHAALTKVLNQTLSGVRYLSIEPLQSPQRLRTDANFREEVYFNCQITKELS